VGVVLDGEQILFLRSSRKAQALATPVPVSVDGDRRRKGRD
jgi:hypothetical protein